MFLHAAPRRASVRHAGGDPNLRLRFPAATPSPPLRPIPSAWHPRRRRGQPAFAGRLHQPAAAADEIRFSGPAQTRAVGQNRRAGRRRGTADKGLSISLSMPAPEASAAKKKEEPRPRSPTCGCRPGRAACKAGERPFRNNSTLLKKAQARPKADRGRARRHVVRAMAAGSRQEKHSAGPLDEAGARWAGANSVTEAQTVERARDASARPTKTKPPRQSAGSAAPGI